MLPFKQKQLPHAQLDPFIHAKSFWKVDNTGQHKLSTQGMFEHAQHGVRTFWTNDKMKRNSDTNSQNSPCVMWHWLLLQTWKVVDEDNWKILWVVHAKDHHSLSFVGPHCSAMSKQNPPHANFCFPHMNKQSMFIDNTFTLSAWTCNRTARAICRNSKVCSLGDPSLSATTEDVQQSVQLHKTNHQIGKEWAAVLDCWMGTFVAFWGFGVWPSWHMCVIAMCCLSAVHPVSNSAHKSCNALSAGTVHPACSKIGSHWLSHASASRGKSTAWNVGSVLLPPWALLVRKICFAQFEKGGHIDSLQKCLNWHWESRLRNAQQRLKHGRNGRSNREPDKTFIHSHLRNCNSNKPLSTCSKLNHSIDMQRWLWPCFNIHPNFSHCSFKRGESSQHRKTCMFALLVGVGVASLA